jgi:glycosyltransferase involved in cell wall biosynthesis
MNLQASTTTKKVLLASHHANRRGSAISLVELGIRLPQHGFDPVFVFSKPGPLADDMAARGFGVHQVKRQGLLRLGMIRHVQAIIRQNGIAIAHVNSAVPFSKYVALAARLSGVPVIWHIREPVEDKRMARQRRWILWLANKIVVLTKQQAEFFHPSTMTQRVFNGVDCSRFSVVSGEGALRATLGYSEDDMVFVQIGSIELNKGQYRSILALESVLGSFPTVKLMIVGSSIDLTERCRIDEYLISRPALKAAISFVGERGDIPEILAASDCLLLPSLRESFPRTLMEAMASGRPVIAARSGAIEDMVVPPEEGLLVSPNDVKALSDAMQKMAEVGRSGMREMGLQARTAAMTRFDLDTHVAIISCIYNKVIAKDS